jgi:hypothetical protein
MFVKTGKMVQMMARACACTSHGDLKSLPFSYMENGLKKKIIQHTKIPRA